MARYKRRYSRRRRSTNVIKMKFQSFMDIATSASSMQIITISAGGSEIFRRLGPQFAAYKYYKIGNISVKLVPASTLPVDPTGLSYSPDEGSVMTVDPRDQLTPGMMRITNGEDIFENISGLSDDQQRGIYNNMLLDPRWFKWMLQSGVKRHATPRYWQIGQLHQDKWPGAVVNYPVFNQATSTIANVGTNAVMNAVKTGTGLVPTYLNASSKLGMFQTGHRGVLGWLPTDSLEYVANGSGTGAQLEPFMASPPEIECMKIILPKAYKTIYYYRAFITETVYFKEPIVNLGIPYGSSSNFYRPLDVFHSVGLPMPYTPDENLPVVVPDNKTGGNYGNN